MEVAVSRNFTKQYSKASHKIQLAFQNRVQLLLSNPQHSQLRLHLLQGRLRGYYSINITGDWRALFIYRNDQTIVFQAIGTHSQLYK
ncbi:MAG: type II toxin-antitoxin system mRNA interferase toxin, RelE/StbE family [Candidatus Kerfeldbacteria bacterium]|nr:type II toxin-antitoxin system mRNA interferase toxin, RelE/StbE family [Candidatus Kerfeldbacteria bacterium]